MGIYLVYVMIDLEDAWHNPASEQNIAVNKHVKRGEIRTHVGILSKKLTVKFGFLQHTTMTHTCR